MSNQAHDKGMKMFANVFGSDVAKNMVKHLDKSVSRSVAIFS